MKSLKEIADHHSVRIIDHGADGFAAEVRTPIHGRRLQVIASWGRGWDHVSVSAKSRVPRYGEMKFVKRVFFKRDEWAVEYHPADTSYISDNDNVLHLWRPQDVEIPTPPEEFV